MTDKNQESLLWGDSRSRYGLLMGGTALVGSLLMVSQAFAQDQDQDTMTDEEAEQLEEVIVTGSRIRRSGFTSAAPMDVVSADTAAPQGFTDIGQLLRSTTVAAGSPQVTSAMSTALVSPGGAGVETISLRGLGANRTLVLLNGRRAGPAGIRGSVSSFDMNVLPLSVIDRVEILKDGASTLYGSDAVAGVINIITKKEDGGTVEGFLSQPTQSGGEEYRVNASYGSTWDRGNFRFTMDYYRREELAKGDRDYFACGENYIFKGGQRADPIDPRTGEYKCHDWGWGHVWTYDYAETGWVAGGDGTTNLKPTTGFYLIQYDYNGALAAAGLPSVNDLADPNNPNHMRTPPGWYQVNYDMESYALAQFDHPYQNEESLIPETERWTVMLEGEQELNDHITLYGEALFNRRENYSNHYTQYWSYVYNDNFSFWNYNYDTYLYDLIPGSGGANAEGWTGAQWFSPTPITDHNDASNKVDYSRFVAGMKGDFGDVLPTWEFDLSFQYSKSDAEYWNQVIYQDSLYANNPYWWHSPDYGYIPGSGTCEGTVTNVRGVPCVDVPWLDPDLMNGIVSDEVADFLFGDDLGTTVYQQYSVEGLVTGELLEVPAGPVGAAIGVHWRDDSILDSPGPVVQAGNAWGLGTGGITEGSHTTKAIFGELEVPLLRDMPMIEHLSANVSGRYTDVSSYGSGTTYKVGLNWQVTPSFRIRATQGTSFRTPALFELYLKDEVSYTSPRIDPCRNWGAALAEGTITQRIADNCAASGAPADHVFSVSPTVLTGGGLGVLQAETSKAKTLGFILTPSFADLSISVDYFDIQVNDEVDQLGPYTILRECYDSQDYPNEPLCDLFDRLPYDAPLLAGGITEVRDSFINIASQVNKGWDINATWTTPFYNGWTLRIDTQHTIQTKDTRGRFAGQEEDLNGLLGQPKWVGNVIFNFDKENWNVTWGMRFVGKGDSTRDNDGVTTTTWFAGLDAEETFDIVQSVPRWTYHNVSASYRMEQNNMTVRVGISNVFDKEPPQVSRAGATITMGRSAFYSQYDWEGRRFFLQLKKDF